MDRMGQLFTMAGASNTAHANRFCRAAAAKVDARQEDPPRPYQVPPIESRFLMARLVFEEAKETIDALGFEVAQEFSGGFVIVPKFGSARDDTVDLEKVIDGACDTIFVATGVLVGCGVPDTPHLAEVCRANEAKFPNGLAVMNPSTGKYLRPPGWVPPDHAKVQQILMDRWNGLV